jgi:hypothetical protein
VAYRLGPLAQPAGLSLRKRDLAWMMLPVAVQFIGIVFVHVHAVAEHPWGVLPISLACCMALVSFSSLFLLYYSWMIDFQQSAKNLVAKGPSIKVFEAQLILDRFNRFKFATSDLIFALLPPGQVMEIFSLYNIFTGIQI